MTMTRARRQTRGLATLLLLSSAMSALGLGAVALDQAALRHDVSGLKGRVTELEDNVLTDPVDTLPSDGR